MGEDLWLNVAVCPNMVQREKNRYQLGALIWAGDRMQNRRHEGKKNVYIEGSETVRWMYHTVGVPRGVCIPDDSRLWRHTKSDIARNRRAT